MNSHIPPGSGIHPVREKKTNKPGKIRSQAERSTKHHMPPNPTGLRWLEGWERPCHRFQLVTCWRCWYVCFFSITIVGFSRSGWTVQSLFEAQSPVNSGSPGRALGANRTEPEVGYSFGTSFPRCHGSRPHESSLGLSMFIPSMAKEWATRLKIWDPVH